MLPTQAAKDLLRKYFLPSSSQAPDSSLMFVSCWYTLERKHLCSPGTPLSHKCPSDRELRLKSYLLFVQKFIHDPTNREDAYVYSTVHSSVIEMSATLISSRVLNCPFLETKWCGELFIILMLQISTMSFC